MGFRKRICCIPRLLFIIATLAILPGVTSAQSVDLLSSRGFPRFRGNNSNTGASPYKAKKPSRAIWSLAVDGEFYSPPSMGPDGTIYVGATDDVLYALRPNGSIVFTRRITRSTFFIPFSTPTVGPDGTVYIGCRDWTVRTFAPNGAPRKVYHVDEAVRTAPLVSDDGNIYFGSGKSFYAYGPTGKPLWMHRFERLIYPVPVLTRDGRILFTDGRHMLYCIDGWNGAQLWEFETEGFISDYPMALPDGRVVITCHSAGKNMLYILGPSGETDQVFYLNDWLPYTPILGLDGTLIVASFSGFIYAITTDGKSQWKFKVPLSFPPAITVDASGTVLVGGLDGYLYAIGKSGNFLWKLDIGSPIHAAPLIGTDGKIYVCTVGGILYALG